MTSLQSIMNSNIKRKNRPNATSKPVRPKGPQEKSVTVEGVYCNTRFMHSAASIVGCIVQVQTKDGSITEGVFKTFSPKMELVLEMPYKVDKKAAKVSSIHNLDPSLGSFINNFNTQDYAPEKLIFSLEDVVLVNAVNVDLDYATKCKGFTDSSISKFNGQIVERELEPWEGPPEVFDGTVSLESNDDTKNGWDPNEMFKTNAEKYGVTSTYDSTLQGYTVPLERKNTEEYKQQEAKAVKIALEIENTQQHHARTALENGDEEERYSAVIRPTENMHNCSSRYVPPQRRRNIPGGKPVRNVTQPSSQNQSKLTHHAGAPVYPHNNGRFVASIPSPTVAPLNHDYSKPPLTSQTPVIPAQQRPMSPHRAARFQESKKIRVNGNEMSQLNCRTEESKTAILTGNLPIAGQNSSKATPVSQSVTSTVKPCEKKKDLEKNGGNQKGRDEQLAEFKRFSSDFRVSF
ncbi:ataxin-2-like [Limulus polyphemus]|uniref:Ataxin-2-like n=1 Tax=Limulus polyphemus TaxID=6850 RepID=A0ABM1BPW3_LIMPO|nr:ataxin-2-like [Limulus polyphemus]